MKIKNALKRFAYETFRPRSKEDYTELFTRGRGGDEKTPYPWFYARVFLFCLLLFTVVCVGFSASNNDFIIVAFAGGIFADLTFIVLLCEIYPKRDFPLLTAVFALFAGGLLSGAFIYTFYGIANYRADFASQAWTAFVEETGKVLATIIILLILKKRDPFSCLIIGAAVGGGFSAFENMWYMYVHGLYWSSGLSDAMQTGLWRALGTPFSHAAWAAAFAWAISGSKPWKKWQPYAVYAFNYTMHFFVNFPLTQQFAEWKGYPISAVTGVLSIAFLIYLIVISRRAVAAQSMQSGFQNSHKIHGGITPLPHSQSYSKTDNSGYVLSFIDVDRYKFIANVLAAAAIFCFSFTLLGPTCVFGGYKNSIDRYCANIEEARAIVQLGNDFTPDYEREYVEYEDISENYEYTWHDGEITYVTQREQYGDFYYRYVYAHVEYQIYVDEEGEWFAYQVYESGDTTGYEIYDEFDFDKAEIIYGEDGTPEAARIWLRGSIMLEYDDSLYNRRIVATGRVFDEEDLHYFNVNPECYGIYFTEEDGFYVIMYGQTAVRAVESIVFTCMFGAAFIGCGIAYIVYKTKIRRYKNVER